MTPFNVQDDEGLWLCPACGFPGYSSAPAYTDEGRGLIGLTICACCLWEPGFDDDPNASRKARETPMTSLLAYRNAWATTFLWAGKPERRPPDFDGRAQLERLRILAPDLFPD